MIIMKMNLATVKFLSKVWKTEIVEWSHGSWKSVYNHHFTKPSQFLSTFSIFFRITTTTFHAHPPPRRLLFTTDRNHYRIPQPIKMQSCADPTPNGCIYETTPPASQAQGASQKRGWKDRKSQRSRGLAMSLGLLVMSHTVSPMWLPRHYLN